MGHLKGTFRERLQKELYDKTVGGPDVKWVSARIRGRDDAIDVAVRLHEEETTKLRSCIEELAKRVEELGVRAWANAENARAAECREMLAGREVSRLREVLGRRTQDILNRLDQALDAEPLCLRAGTRAEILRATRNALATQGGERCTKRLPPYTDSRGWLHEWGRECGKPMPCFDHSKPEEAPEQILQRVLLNPATFSHLNPKPEEGK